MAYSFTVELCFSLRIEGRKLETFEKVSKVLANECAVNRDSVNDVDCCIPWHEVIRCEESGYHRPIEWRSEAVLQLHP